MTSSRTPDTAANGHGSHGMIPHTQTGRERGTTSQDLVYINCLATLVVFVCARFHDFLLLWLKHSHTHKHTHTEMSAARNQYQYTSSGLTHLAVGFKAVAQPGRGARAWDKPKKRDISPALEHWCVYEVRKRVFMGKPNRLAVKERIWKHADLRYLSETKKKNPTASCVRRFFNVVLSDQYN